MRPREIEQLSFALHKNLLSKEGAENDGQARIYTN